MPRDTGFYKRRRGILEHLEAGKISLLDSGIHDFLSLKMNAVAGSGSNIPPGVVFTSSRAICAQCPFGADEREIRRSLERLERLGWIKRWQQPGKRGNYPILIARSSVHDAAGNEYRVNAAETIDWRSPVLIPAATCPRDVRDVSTDREVETKEERKKQSTAAKIAPPTLSQPKCFPNRENQGARQAPAVNPAVPSADAERFLSQIKSVGRRMPEPVPAVIQVSEAMRQCAAKAADEAMKRFGNQPTTADHELSQWREQHGIVSHALAEPLEASR